jgi:hypothetical protein
LSRDSDAFHTGDERWVATTDETHAFVIKVLLEAIPESGDDEGHGRETSVKVANGAPTGF